MYIYIYVYIYTVIEVFTCAVSKLYCDQALDEARKEAANTQNSLKQVVGERDVALRRCKDLDVSVCAFVYTYVCIYIYILNMYSCLFVNTY